MESLNVYINEAWSGVKKQSLKAEITAWCEEMGIQNYTINDKGEIDVNGYVDLNSRDFKVLPYKFRTVREWFTLANSENLISLKNCPDIVGNFYCNGCTNLKSLEGCPQYIRGTFACNDCTNLKSLKGCPEEVYYFSCDFCPKLESLEGCPSVVKDSFDCSHCTSLKSLEGSPHFVGGSFRCSGCLKLDSLEGCPKEVGDDFYCNKCKQKFTKEDVRSLCKVKRDIVI